MALIYWALFGLGLLLIHTAALPGWRAFGLGLMLPGGGFLAYGSVESLSGLVHLALAAGGFAAFGLALIAWFATGNVLLPPLIWLGAALAALLMNHPIRPEAEGLLEGLPLGVAALILTAGLATALLRQAQSRAGRRNHVYVETQRPVFAEARRAPTPAAPDELSETEVTRLRFLLDRALQPLDAFDGFQWVDQFQSAAVRYQLNFAGYALAFAQVKHLEAFRGYYARAQRNLIEKQRDHRVWRYWQLENLWGNLSRGADPIPHDNIMYSGFVAAQIAYFQAATGDLRYSAPGAFTLQHPDGRSFRHDFHSMIASLKQGWQRSPYFLMACEPNWVYPLCNGIGATAVAAHDRQFDRRDWPAIAPRFLAALHREFVTPAGRLVPFRSTYTGLAAPQIGGAVADAYPCLFYSAVLPGEAVRLWLLAKRDMLEADGSLKTGRFWPIDTGDYRFSRATSYAGVAAAATQMGDSQTAERTLAALEAECPSQTQGGVIHRSRASVWAHAVELMARFGSENGLADLISSGTAKPRGPVIDTESYPDCLVAKACWQGSSLHAVLYPGGVDGRQPLRLSGFRPHADYRCEGCAEARGTADSTGRAEIQVMLSGRSELRVHT